MTQPEHDRGRPGERAASKLSNGDIPRIPPSTDESSDAIAGAHAVLVSTPSGRWSRRLYLSLHAADKAMERARARGQVAHCVMVELVPVPGVPVTVVGGDDL